jgi:hypothetical protein
VSPTVNIGVLAASRVADDLGKDGFRTPPLAGLGPMPGGVVPRRRTPSGPPPWGSRQIRSAAGTGR